MGTWESTFRYRRFADINEYTRQTGMGYPADSDLGDRAEMGQPAGMAGRSPATRRLRGGGIAFEEQERHAQNARPGSVIGTGYPLLGDGLDLARVIEI
jgi:hypothetical protein